MRTKKNPFSILLYYKYQKIENLPEFVAEHKAFCEKHKICGRILIAEDGINGTCAGTLEDIEMYKNYVHSLKGFEDLWFKEHSADYVPFKDIQVRARKEIVALGVDGLDKADRADCKRYISPEEVNDLFEMNQNDDLADASIIFFDVRNRIESKIGRFKNAITPNIEFFRELPDVLDQYAHLKDKKIVLYCTGGIRCEKASLLFKQKGFKDVCQIEGGIYNYCSKYPDGHFEGTCFVFDERMQIAFDKDHKSIDGSMILQGKEIPENKIISHCDFCNKKTNRVVNDERNNGHHLVVCCEECDRSMDISTVRYKKVH